MQKTHYSIITDIILSEKSDDLKDQDKYAFKVRRDANKIEIAAAVEKAFPDVKVKNVNTANYMGKKKRVNRHVGNRPDWKKAVVTLSEGTIDLV